MAQTHPGDEELFRLLVVTPVTVAPSKDVGAATIDFDVSRPEPQFLRRLRDHTDHGGGLDEAIGLAQEHVASSAYRTSLGLAEIAAGGSPKGGEREPSTSAAHEPSDDAALEADVRYLAETLDPASSDLSEALRRRLGRPIAEVGRDPALTTRLDQLWDSLYAAYLLADDEPADLARIVDAIGVGELLVRAADDPTLLNDIERRTALVTASPLLPSAVFADLVVPPEPPAAIAPITGTVIRDTTESTTSTAGQQEIAQLEGAISELERVEAVRLAAASVTAPAAESPADDPGPGSPLAGPPDELTLPWSNETVAPWRLTATEVGRLSATTRDVLGDLDVSEGLTVPITVEALERRRDALLLACLEADES